MRTDLGRRRRATRANTASAKPLWATSGDPVDILRPLPFSWASPCCLGNCMIGRLTRDR